MDSGNSPIVFAERKAAKTGFQMGTECCVLIATREETTQRRLNSSLMRQIEHIGKEWSGNYIGESKRGLKSIVLKICPRKNSVH